MDWAPLYLSLPVFCISRQLMQGLHMQEHKYKLCRTCYRCKTVTADTWRVEIKHILPPPKYLIIIVNWLNYTNTTDTNSRGLIALDLNIMLGRYNFILQAIVNPRGHSINCAYCIFLSIIVGKHFYCKHTRITECNISDTHYKRTMLLYNLIVDCLWPDPGGWELIDSHGADTFFCLLNIGRGMYTETWGIDNVYPPDDIWFGSDTGYLWDMLTCLTNGGRDGQWLPALSGYELSCIGCWLWLLH